MRITSVDEILPAVHSLSTPTYMSSYEDITEYYRGKDGRNWTGALATDLAPLLPAGNKPLKYPRGAALRNIQRYEKGDSKIGKKYKDAFKELGKLLPPIKLTPPKGGFTLLFSGYVAISETCESRNFEETVTGIDAVALVNDPSFEKIMDAYFPAGLVAGPCGSWELEIEAIK